MERFAVTQNLEFQQKAFEINEKSRARSLLETLALAQVNIRQGVSLELLEKEKKIRKKYQDESAQLSRISLTNDQTKIAEAQKIFAEAEEDLQVVEAEIRKASPHYSAITQLQATTLDETQKLLDNDTILLEYSLGAEKSFLWAVTNNSIQTVDLPKGEVIENKARQVYQLLNAREKEIKFETAADKQKRIEGADRELTVVGKELSEILLGQVANQLENKRVVVVADGALQYIPFAGLKLNDKYLVESNEVVNLPSVSALSVLRNTKKTPANKTIAVVADPVFDKNDARLSKLNSNKKDGIAESTRAISDNLSWEDWNGEESDFYIPRLPYTRNEAETVSKLAPANQQKISLDFEATRDLALSDELKNYRIVHFATHGILNSKNPAMSGLVFSLVDKDGKFRNGFLRTDETYNLKLSADLVVLSGCKTGLGKEIRGEGLVGMTRGFMYAGASRVMVSLWDVDDQATAELMKFFYQNLLGKKMGYGQSLRQAQLSMIKDKKYSAPFYWSAFTLQGEF